MEIEEATKQMKKICPSISKTFLHNNIIYFEFDATDDKILMSKHQNQWLLTINSIYYVAAIGKSTPDDIIHALQCINEKKPIIPNVFALELRKIMK